MDSFEKWWEKVRPLPDMSDGELGKLVWNAALASIRRDGEVAAYVAENTDAGDDPHCFMCGAIVTNGVCRSCDTIAVAESRPTEIKTETCGALSGGSGLFKCRDTDKDHPGPHSDQGVSWPNLRDFPPAREDHIIEGQKDVLPELPKPKLYPAHGSGFISYYDPEEVDAVFSQFLAHIRSTREKMKSKTELLTESIRQFNELLSQHQQDVEKLERATDLVRHQRHELLREKLVSLEEYAALVADSDDGQRVARLPGYDAVRKAAEEKMKLAVEVAYKMSNTKCTVPNCEWCAIRIKKIISILSPG